MTSRDRVRAALAGESVDRRPLVTWPTVTDAADIVVLKDVDAIRPHAGGDRPVLLEVANPYASVGRTVVSEAKANPEESARALDEAVAAIRRQIEAGLGAGADGVFYRLEGATAEATTPMEYGGLFLEHDREILAAISDAQLNVLYLSGGPDLYFDFVCDLPAHLIAWDQAATGLSAEMVRALRSGPQASADPASEFDLSINGVLPTN